MSTVRDALLSFARCFGLDQQKAVYVSTPITTGPSFLAWRRQDPSLVESHPGYDADHREQVVEGNLARAQQVVTRVRGAFAGPVIDPTRLADVEGWRQADYHRFWAEVVVSFAHTVVFVDGWQYSTGCAVEFAAAVRHRLALLDENLTAFEPARGVKLLAAGIADLSKAGLDVRLLANAAEEASSATGLPVGPR